MGWYFLKTCCTLNPNPLNVLHWCNVPSDQWGVLAFRLIISELTESFWNYWHLVKCPVTSSFTTNPFKIIPKNSVTNSWHRWKNLSPSLASSCDAWLPSTCIRGAQVSTIYTIIIIIGSNFFSTMLFRVPL